MPQAAQALDSAETARRVDAARRILARPDWHDISTRFVLRCVQKGDPEKAEDLQQEVATRFLEGRRPYNPGNPKTPTVKHHLLGLARSLRGRGSLKERAHHVGGEEADQAIDAQHISEDDTPEGKLIAMQERARKIRGVRALVAKSDKGDKFLPLLLLEAADRGGDPRAAADAAGFTPVEVTNALRTLKRLAENLDEDAEEPDDGNLPS